MKRIAAVVVLGLSGAWPAVAQQDSTLQEAVRLATEGQGDSAQALVRARMAALSVTDSLFAEVLYTAGVVAGDSDSALTYFRRVSIEHPRSDWADRSLLRMSQIAYARGELRAAVRSAERALLDYPFSEVLPQAAFWAGRALVELGEAERGCTLLGRAETEAGEDVELGNRARYLLQRCSGFAPADSAGGQPGERPAPRTPTVYSVQIAAVQSAAAADELMRSLARQGYDPHAVRDEDGLLKIRIGRFARRAEAERVLREVRAKIGGQPFIVEVRP